MQLGAARMPGINEIDKIIDAVVENAEELSSNARAVLRSTVLSFFIFLAVVVCVTIWDSKDSLNNLLQSRLDRLANGPTVVEVIKPYQTVICSDYQYLCTDGILRQNFLKDTELLLNSTLYTVGSDRIVFSVYNYEYRQMVVDVHTVFAKPIPRGYWSVANTLPGYGDRISRMRREGCIVSTEEQLLSNQATAVWVREFDVKNSVQCPVNGYAYVTADFSKKLSEEEVEATKKHLTELSQKLVERLK